MFIFRRIHSSDSILAFSTGDKVFNDINPDGTLLPYVKDDEINNGIFKTHILLKQEKNITEVCGLLRYSFKKLEDLKAELESCTCLEINISKIEKLVRIENYAIIYLSRVGVSENQQNKHLSQVILDFFDFYLFELKKNILVYTKVRMGSSKFLGPLYQVIASNQDSHWGDYSVCVRSIKIV